MRFVATQLFVHGRSGSAVILIGVLFWALLATGCARGTESVYTELSEKACPIEEFDDETGSTRQLCPGVAGYSLALLFDDERISINVIVPGGEEFPLNYWEVISGGFTSHGTRAEWRVAEEGGKQVPKALIVQVDAFEDPDHPEAFTSYLAVAKITPGQACVTDKIAPGPDQDPIARRAADASAGKPCLPVPTATVSSDVEEPYGTPARFLECDIWGATMFARDLPPFHEEGPVVGEEGVFTQPSLVGPFPELIAQVWNKSLNIDPQDHSGGSHDICLTTDRAAYEMFLIARSETEGTRFSLREFDSLSECKEAISGNGDAAQVLPFPKTPLSQNCPFLTMGASRDQIEKHLGPGDVKHGQSQFYLQLNTPEFRSYCRNWLNADDEPSCCYPAMALTFSGDRLIEIVIHDGRGEGPPCDQMPTKGDEE